MIKTLIRIAITGILSVKMLSGIAGIVNMAVTILSALVVLAAFVEVLPVLLIAKAADELARRAASPRGLAA
jgi:hypothetical protein